MYRLMQLAKERNIAYEPSYSCQMALNDYMERKSLPNPYDDGKKQMQAPMAMPQYNPQNFGGPSNSDFPPPGNDFGGGPGGQVPQQPMMPPM